MEELLRIKVERYTDIYSIHSYILGGIFKWDTSTVVTSGGALVTYQCGEKWVKHEARELQYKMENQPSIWAEYIRIISQKHKAINQKSIINNRRMNIGRESFPFPLALTLDSGQESDHDKIDW